MRRPADGARLSHEVGFKRSNASSLPAYFRFAAVRFSPIPPRIHAAVTSSRRRNQTVNLRVRRVYPPD